MKITTTHTEKKEIEITLPCFTKVVGFSTAFYCIKNENEALRVEQLAGTKITTVSHYSSVSEAFIDGFEFIDKATFFQNYDLILSKMYDDMEELQETLVEDETNEKQDDEGYEYNPETESMN